MTDSARRARVQDLVGADLASEMLATVRASGGEGRRKDLIDAAIDRHGWTADELAVGPDRQGAAQDGRVRLAYDDALDVLKRRGDVESTGQRGYWRLTDQGADGPHGPSGGHVDSSVPQHPFGRIYLASVGVSGSPVGDDYDPAAYGHLWFAKSTKHVVKGGHVFIVGVSLKGAVLGLYRVESGGMRNDVPHPTDSERWPWSLAVTPLASVRASAATRVAGVVAPQGSLVRAKPELFDALYDAVAGHALPQAADASETHTTETVSPVVEVAGPEVVLRRSRVFDPDQAPTPAEVSEQTWVAGGEALALQEKARQGHHEILGRLAGHLQDAGWSAPEEIPMAVDLWSTSPTVGRVLFEAKTLHDANAVKQCRSGLAQLLEYRVAHGTPQDALCLVTDRPVDPERTEVLQALDVAVLTVGQDGWRAENARAVALGLGTATLTGGVEDRAA